ncbi:MAG: FixH family protein [Nannocystaceae bacterium]
MARATRSALAIACALATGCDAAGTLGAPCERGSDCHDGLACDLHGAGGSCQKPHTDANDPPPPACATETRDDTYALGLDREGTWARARFVDAQPAPPARGDNTWLLDIVDHDGAPMTGLELTVDPYMPDHAHGTAIRCEVDEQAPGRYALSPINLFMPGLWQVTIAVRDGAREDEVVFSFCVDP